MEIQATLPEKGRDLRLDFFRGIANWWIFLDHIPNNVINWATPETMGSATPRTSSSLSRDIPHHSSMRV